MSGILCETCIGVLHHRRHAIHLPPISRELDDESKAELYVECGHHLTCESLIAAAADGCPVCWAIWDHLDDHQQDLVRASGPNSNATLTADASRSDFVTFVWLQGYEKPHNFALIIEYNDEMFPQLHNQGGHFILEKEDAYTLSQHIHTKGHITTDSTSSHESLQMAAMWLRECAQFHTRCNTLKGDEQWYPTRLLHLVESQGDDYVHLIRTAEQLPNGHYATLSHCWGNVKPLQLTHSMASDPNHRFPMADMPKTFQEAVQVCKRLGIQYLWIDSLCIIQEGDNRRDWYHEAGLMNKVYTHSHLNISAADAEDSTKGLFRSRIPLPVVCQPIRINISIVGPGAEFVDCLITDLWLWPRTVLNSHINKRGWVFQERFLAPRILYFCRNQVFWECKEHIVCETFPAKDLMEEIGEMGYYDYSSTKIWERQSHTSEPAIGDYVWTHFWYDCIVCQYSKMKLTFSTDKLIALSGIAKYFIARLEDTYVAGMWRKQLEIGMCWSVYVPRPRPTPYRSPSWSWASVDAPIASFIYPMVTRTLIHVEDVVLTHATDDTSGAVTDGWLDLRGCLKPMRLYESEERDADWCMAVDNPIMSERHGTIQESASSRFRILLDVLPGDASTLSSCNAQGRYFYMPCLIIQKSERVVRCLLLKLVDKEKVIFERIGSVDISRTGNTELLLADLDDETKARLPCLRYENGLHTIRII